MEGFDSRWLPCGAERRAAYTNLEGGEYVFRVRVSTATGCGTPRAPRSGCGSCRPGGSGPGWFLPALLVARPSSWRTGSASAGSGSSSAGWRNWWCSGPRNCGRSTRNWKGLHAGAVSQRGTAGAQRQEDRVPGNGGSRPAEPAHGGAGLRGHGSENDRRQPVPADAGHEVPPEGFSEACEKMNALLTSFIAAIETGSLAVVMHPENPVRLLLESADFHRGRPNARRSARRTSRITSPTWSRIGSGCRQVLDNLPVRAVKYTPPGGDPPPGEPGGPFRGVGPGQRAPA